MRSRKDFIGLLSVALLSVVMPMPSRGEVINFDDAVTVPEEVPRPEYHGLIFSGVGYANNVEGIQSTTSSSDPGVHNGIVSSPNVLVTANQGLSIQSPRVDGDYPKTFTFKGAYFTAATNEGLTVTIEGTRWGRDKRTKTFVLSTQSPTFVSFNWSGIDEIQISAYGGTPTQRNSTAVVIDDLSIEMDGPFTFTPVTPCRLVDTRNPAGSFGGPQMAAGTVREFAIPDNGDCDIPWNASAYAINVTLVPGGPLNFLTIWPTGQDQPNVSALNSDGRIKAVGVIVPAGTNGAVSVFGTDSTHLILDITGYFSSQPGLAFYPLTPCRVADTRDGAGDLGGPSLAGGGQGRSIPILLSTCGIPPGAQAYALNFTAVPHGPLGYLTVWPDGQAQTSRLNLKCSDRSRHSERGHCSRGQCRKHFGVCE